MKMRLFRQSIVACAVGLAFSGSLTLATAAHGAPALPVQGTPVPALAEFDRVMLKFMVDNKITAGQLAISRNGVVVLERSYGWQDKRSWRDRQHIKPLLLGAPMRTASVSKPFTAAAIRMLVAQGRLSLKTPVFSLRPGDGGILDLVPFGTPDPKLKDITIEHCLRHLCGWDRDHVVGRVRVRGRWKDKKLGDWTYKELEVAKAMGIASPPSAADMARYIMGQPLQFVPGKQPLELKPGKTRDHAYSNIGYLMLGLVIARLNGWDPADESADPAEYYLSFLHRNVTGPAGTKDSDLIKGRSLLADADPREPYYHHPRTLPNVFDLDPKTEERVEAPYGSFHMEARIGQGNIVTNARSIVQFLGKFTASGPGIGKPRQATPGNWKHNHTGRQRGTSALARQRGDGINYAVIFNKDSAVEDDEGDKGYAAQIRRQLDRLIDSGATKWP